MFRGKSKPRPASYVLAGIDEPKDVIIDARESKWREAF